MEYFESKARWFVAGNRSVDDVCQKYIRNQHRNVNTVHEMGGRSQKVYTMYESILMF